MATIKSYTDLQQSRKLAEILPLESADMIWVLANPDLPMIKAIAYKDSEKSKYYEILPAWSLSALLGILPEYHLSSPNPLSSMYCCRVEDIETYANTQVDACYEVIIKLYELKML